MMTSPRLMPRRAASLRKSTSVTSTPLTLLRNASVQVKAERSSGQGPYLTQTGSAHTGSDAQLAGCVLGFVERQRVEPLERGGGLTTAPPPLPVRRSVGVRERQKCAR